MKFNIKNMIQMNSRREWAFIFGGSEVFSHLDKSTVVREAKWWLQIRQELQVAL